MREELEHRLQALGARGHRALIAGVIRGDERVCCGWSARAEKPDERTLFEIGSITKAFTGVLLADMVLSGELSLDDPLSRHLPGPRPAWRHREPTLLELATHRSALPNTPKGMGRRELSYSLGFGAQDPWAALSPHDYERLVRRESPRRAPGGRVRYSSMAAGLLGDALAARAGKPYDELLHERILGPLEMSATAVHVDPAWAGKLLGGHSRRGEPRPAIHDFMPAAGSLRSNAEDMLRFLTACLQPPAQPLGPALALAQQPQARIGRRLEIGLCWMISRRPRHPRIVWHNGGTWGFRSFAGFAPQQARAAVVMSNTARSVDRLGFRLVDTTLQPELDTGAMAHADKLSFRTPRK
jgi:D-alanyl-D-alanine-carboxypeptidase/D-alanyl-D-alanine-endopeptidase